MQAWLAGSVGGGPNSDGKYPITDYLAVTTLVTSPAQLEADVENIVTGAGASATAAAASAAAASSSASTASTQASNASSSASAAATSASGASSSASAASSSAATATAQAGAASTSAAAALASQLLAQAAAGDLTDPGVNSVMTWNEGTNTPEWSTNVPLLNASNVFSSAANRFNGIVVLQSDGAYLQIKNAAGTANGYFGDGGSGNDIQIDATNALQITSGGALTLNGVNATDYARLSQANLFTSATTIGPFNSNHLELQSSTSTYGWKLDTTSAGDVPLTLYRKAAGAYTEAVHWSNSTGDMTLSNTDNATHTLAVSDTNSGSSTYVRLALSGGDSSASLFSAGSNYGSALVTGGPTGAQTVLRNLGAYPIIFGTDNTARSRISQEISIADDATATFPVNSGVILITSSYGAVSTGMFYVFQNSEQANIYAAANVSVGNGSNPDVDGNANYWKSAAGTLSIKNRLGSTRSFYVTTFGEF